MGLARAPLDVLVDRLAAADGVGVLGAQLTAMIGYGRLDCFPSADPLVREWIGRNYFDGASVEPFQADEWARPWGNQRALVAYHIYAELMEQGRL